MYCHGRFAFVVARLVVSDDAFECRILKGLEAMRPIAGAAFASTVCGPAVVAIFSSSRRKDVASGLGVPSKKESDAVGNSPGRSFQTVHGWTAVEFGRKLFRSAQVDSNRTTALCGQWGLCNDKSLASRKKGVGDSSPSNRMRSALCSERYSRD